MRPTLVFVDGNPVTLRFDAGIAQAIGGRGYPRQEAAYLVTRAIKAAHMGCGHVADLNLTEQEEAIAKKAVELLTT